VKIFALIGVTIVALTFAEAKPPADIQKQLDSFIKGSSGGAALVWVDSEGAAFFQSGKYSAKDARAITPNTQFELGSVTKVFTSLLLVESERLGKVSRLDSAAKYLLPADDPAQPALAKITLLSLATHTSGLPSLPSKFPYDPANPDPYATYNREQLVQALRTDGVVAPAHNTMAYSNFGVAVLGEALASAWKTTYADALRTHVLTPLGLKKTSVGLAGEPASSELAPGHVNDKVVPNWTQLAFAPAGALRSSAREMAIFLKEALAIDDESPLHAAFEATLQPQFVAEDMGGHIGLSWMLIDDPAHSAAWHNGATAGSHSFVAIDRKSGRGLAILVNSENGPEALGFGLLGVNPPRPKVEPVKDTTSYIGRYPLSPTFAIDVKEEQGGLHIQATGQPAFRLREVSPDYFTVVGVPAEISFERDSKGKVTALVLHQNGASQRGVRGDLPPPPKEVTLPVEALRQYVGNYPIAPTFVIAVTEEGGALFIQATDQPKFPVFASAKDEFFLKVVDAQISFQRNDAGKVIGLILHQNGNDMPGKRAAD
jgi:CubicO group peptidase (beta-lactamase class C family)